MLINGSTPRYSAQPFAPYGKKLTLFDSHIGVTPCFRNRTGGRTASCCVVVTSAVLRETPHREPGEVMVVQDWAGPSGRQWLEAERNSPRTKCPPIGGLPPFSLDPLSVFRTFRPGPKQAPRFRSSGKTIRASTLSPRQKRRRYWRRPCCT